MIRSYDRSGLLQETLDLLRDMHVMRVKPSEIGMISITHVLEELADLKLGKALLAYVMRNGKCGKSRVPLCTALIDMYVKCENLAYARRVFDGLSKASIICWTAMIATYIHCNNLNEEQLNSRECENLGFIGLVLCSDCNTLSEYVKDKDYLFDGWYSLTCTSDYLNRLNQYRQRVWTCKITGKSGLTYEEALVSEKHAAEKVQQIPEELVAPALRIIHYNK
ncbi:pentatricopeptide repeat-containing protein At2g03380, mitochondrial-like [Glycine soja]|uniref:pentatricopeptide repeat-containing protein At2g03380, mitochondrial-like n=1 Tax=Glycine soja TaxID=3848 RepID=UPI00103F4E8C|nr:pentatricopeptide repeat-containing protein At2g03380, mitochondrial-like [Glycine soja]